MEDLRVLSEQLRGLLVQQGLAERSGASVRADLHEVMSKFDKLVRKLRKNNKVRDPEALAAWIGRRLGRLKQRGGR